MGVTTFAETFATAAAGGSTSERTSLPNPMKVVIAKTTNRTSGAEGLARADLRRSFGIATGIASRYCISDQNDDAATTTATDKMHRDDAILGTLGTTGAVDRLIDVSDFQASAVTFRVDDGSGTNMSQSCWYLGGSDFTNAELFTFNQATSAGNQAVTLPFADPTCLIFFSSGGAQDINTAAAGGAFMIGACVKQSGQLSQAVASTVQVDAAADSDVAQYCRSGQALAFIDPADTSQCAARGAVTAISGTSLTINWAAADATARKIFCLAMKGPQFALKTFTTKTDTSTEIPVTAGFEPRGGMLVGVADSEHADNTPTAHDQLSLGFFTSPTVRVSHFSATADAQAAGHSTVGHSTDEALSFVDLADTPATEYEIDVASVTSTGVNFVHDTAAAADTDFVWVVLIGDGLPQSTAQQPFWRWHY